MKTKIDISLLTLKVTLNMWELAQQEELTESTLFMLTIKFIFSIEMEFKSLPIQDIKI